MTKLQNRLSLAQLVGRSEALHEQHPEAYGALLQELTQQEQQPA